MLDKVEKVLNNRPRRCLKFNSPSEILKDVKKIANLRELASTIDYYALRN
jgi:IS30 family transposase